jgi:hypothetical protein
MICSFAIATYRVINIIVAFSKGKLNENISRSTNNGQDPVPDGLPCLAAPLPLTSATGGKHFLVVVIFFLHILT